MLQKVRAVGFAVLIGLMGFAGAQKFGVYVGYSGANYRFTYDPGGGVKPIHTKLGVGGFNIGGFYAFTEKIRVGGDIRFGRVNSSYEEVNQSATDNIMGFSLQGTYLFGRVQVPIQDVALKVYYGAHAELVAYLGQAEFDGNKYNYSVSELNINGVVGVEYPLATDMGVFAELLVGPSYGSYSAEGSSESLGALSFAYTLRMGVSVH